MSDDTTKYLLTEDKIPTHWINIAPTFPANRCRR